MTTILLIQLLEQQPLGISSLEMKFSRRFGGQLVAMDNFSDSSNLAYVRKMIETSEKTTVVIWVEEGVAIKGMQPIFNGLLKKKQDVSLISNSNQGVIAKLLKAIDSKVVNGEEELMEAIV